METSDLAQIAKVKWALEGDENTSFFHGTLKNKRLQLAIKGVLKNGEWVKDPGLVKAEFLDHFRNCFEQHTGIPPSLDSDMLNPLSYCHRDFLECPFSRDEIRSVVWDCGGDRAPGPDGFTFKFFMSFWDLIEDDVARFVHEFFRSYHFPTVDFEKSFDSLSWDFLDLILDKLGIGIKWPAWIKGSLHNSHSSVLVNGSPTAEFELFRGLRQGDPMSPFLFILAMEGLHALTSKAEASGLFKGASVGCNNMYISHLKYADDVFFFGEWSWMWTGHTIMEELLSDMGRRIPFEIPRRSTRLLSIGGRLSLIKSVLGNLPTYYMSIYLMPVSIHKKLESMRNRFFIGDLWVRVIQSIHGVEEGINIANINQKCSTWSSFLSSIVYISKSTVNASKSKSISLLEGKKIGVLISVAQDTLFLGNLNKEWSADDFNKVVRQVFPDVGSIDLSQPLSGSDTAPNKKF
ncbi:RNA-directed DNA polymerase, eukaryota, reverse transcriptase zinc-binding domain protein [Tanacetum coccineum]